MGFLAIAQFSSIFGRKKLEKAGQAINDGLAAWDPETASEVDIEMMIGKFEDITARVGKAKAVYLKEKAEADAAQSEYDRLLRTAEKIKSALDAEPDNSELQLALEEVVSTLEVNAVELQREKDEANEAEEVFHELEQLAEAYASKVKTAKASLAKARSNMEKARLREERAKDREKQAKELAGLKANTDDLGSALSAFERNAQKANVAAEASELRSKLLKPTQSKSASIIEQFSSDGPEPGNSVSLADRLAKLKK